MIGEVPCWAFDKHVRDGNKALARLLETDCETARWVSAHIPPGQRLGFLGGILFRVESGLVSKRLRWLTADALRQMAEFGCPALRGPDPAEIMELLRRDLPKLNEARRYVVR
jgi:hypothetical protein